MSLGWAVFAAGLHEQLLKEDLRAGVKAWVEMYYREYTQAEELDPDAYRRLNALLSALMDSDLDEEWLHGLINEVQESLKGTLDCDGRVRPAFKRLTVESDDDEEEVKQD